MQRLSDFDSLFTYLARPGMTRRKVAVVCPHDDHTLEAVDGALQKNIADFTLVGDTESPAIQRLTERYPGRVEKIAEPNPDRAARRAVELVRLGNADVLMKGLLNTDNLLRAVLNKQEGILQAGAILSHVTCAEIKSLGRLLFFSDAAVIPSPTPEQHSAIVGYLSSVCHAFGIDEPRIALIHCNEKTSPKFPVTLAYSEIKEQAHAGAFGKAIVDGPMDVKTALDSHAATIKGISTPIDGQADALVFPDIQAGNVFYKTISFFTDSLNAGMLMGAKAPVVLPSRSDSARSKLCSIAMACLYSLS